MTYQVKKALLHVRKYCPDVNHVIFFGKTQHWRFCNEYGEIPTTGDFSKVDTKILEDAVDSITRFPSIFYMDSHDPNQDLLCDRCGELIDRTADCWGVCDNCGDQLCKECAVEWDDHGSCKQCSDRRSTNAKAWEDRYGK